MSKQKGYLIKKVLLLAALLLICLGGVVTAMSWGTRKENIFEEMYYNEYYSATKWFFYPKFAWRKAENIAGQEATTLNSMNETNEQYQADAVSDQLEKLNLSFRFPDGEAKNGTVSILMVFKLSNSENVHVNYLYSLKEKTLVQSISEFIDHQELTNKEIIQSNLKAAGSSLEQIEQLGNNFLKHTVLKDWCSVYDSRFSVDDWGDVKVVTKW
ncbi:TipC family immunity protein [Streptococcus sp. H31]|uniref:TipC family immunity protein n=1 Tax=Streptococcus huangxiaojuni TaxID=3237239 RepID=UPI0034A3C464